MNLVCIFLNILVFLKQAPTTGKYYMFSQKKIKNSQLKNQKGFTLVELMVVCGIMSGMILVMNQMMSNMTKVNLKAQSDSENLLTLNEINAILSSPYNCLAALNGKNAATDNTLTKVIRKGVDKFIVGVKFGNVNTTISSYSINSTPVDITNNSATLKINFDKKNLLGGGIISKKVNLYVEVDSSNNITACRSISSEAPDSLWKHGTVQSNIDYETGNVGIGVSAPNEKLEVNGGVRVGQTTSSCSSANEGTIRLNTSTHLLEYCDSSIWSGIKSVGHP
jgi:prepilin-type N-terminal cleavage/methylation domain-containing protein